MNKNDITEALEGWRVLDLELKNEPMSADTFKFCTENHETIRKALQMAQKVEEGTAHFMEWVDIKEAPKDGTEVLLFVPADFHTGYLHDIASYEDGKKKFFEGCCDYHPNASKVAKFGDSFELPEPIDEYNKRHEGKDK